MWVKNVGIGIPDLDSFDWQMSVEELNVRVVKMEKVAKSLGVKLPPNIKWVELALAVICSICALLRKDGDDASVLLALIKAQVSHVVGKLDHDPSLAVVLCVVGSEGGEIEKSCGVSTGESCNSSSGGELQMKSKSCHALGISLVPGQ